MQKKALHLEKDLGSKIWALQLPFNYSRLAWQNDRLKRKAFLRDCLQKWNLPAEKRNLSAQLPWSSNLQAPKQSFFCETSLIMAFANYGETSVRDFLQNWHAVPTPGVRIQIRLSNFANNSSKVLRPPRKVELVHTKPFNCHVEWLLKLKLRQNKGHAPSKPSVSRTSTPAPAIVNQPQPAPRELLRLHQHATCRTPCVYASLCCLFLTILCDLDFGAALSQQRGANVGPSWRQIPPHPL